jgi:hypothetical protein
MVNFYRRYLPCIACADGLCGGKKGLERLKWSAAMKALVPEVDRAAVSHAIHSICATRCMVSARFVWRGVVVGSASVERSASSQQLLFYFAMPRPLCITKYLATNHF